MTSRRPLAALLAADAVSVMGNTIALLAIPWFVLETTGSAGRTGITAAVTILPVVVSSAFGSALVDRLGFRRTSVIADIASAATVAAIPLLHTTVGLQFWQLLVLVFLGGLLDAPGTTARRALLPELRGTTSLERVTSAHDGVWRGARMLGGPIAGVLLAVMGPTQALYVDAATFVISALLVGFAIPRTPWSHAPEPWSVRGYLTEVREGFAFVRRDPLLRAMIWMVMVTNMLDQAMSGVLVPVYADRVLDSSVDLGLIVGVFGGGALLGTFVYGIVGYKLPRRVTYIVAFLIAGPPRYFVMAATGSLAPVLIAGAIAGFAAGALNPILSSAEYRRIPERLLGRVLGVLTAGVFIAMPIGALAGGYLVEVLGLQPTLLICGAAYLVTVLVPVVSPTWRALDDDAPTPVAAGEPAAA